MPGGSVGRLRKGALVVLHGPLILALTLLRAPEDHIHELGKERRRRDRADPWEGTEDAAPAGHHGDDQLRALLPDPGQRRLGDEAPLPELRDLFPAAGVVRET